MTILYNEYKQVFQNIAINKRLISVYYFNVMTIIMVRTQFLFGSKKLTQNSLVEKK